MNTSISTSSDSRQMPNIRNLGRAIGSGRSALGLLPLLVAVLAVFLSGELCTARRGPGGHDGSVISNNTFKAVTTGPPVPSMLVWRWRYSPDCCC